MEQLLKKNLDKWGNGPIWHFMF